MKVNRLSDVKKFLAAAAFAVAATPFFAFGLSAQEPDGKALYETHCASCHQFDGGGVPMLQPEIIGRPRANGPKGVVIDMILFGSAAMAPNEGDYSNEMPAFDFLTDKEIALIATYVRTHFDNNGGLVTSDDVKPRRAR